MIHENVGSILEREREREEKNGRTNCVSAQIRVELQNVRLGQTNGTLIKGNL